ncbi:MAG: BACON domain-containing protein [Bacteroidales bacterium]|nr:BACON domain-containing protein [Bacteroidales bacterium]
MRKYFYYFAAIAALASCAKQNPVGENHVNESLVSEPQEVTIQAAAPSTKTQLVDGTNVQWTPGDKIKMCFDVKTWEKNNIWTGVEFENIGDVVAESAIFEGSVDVNKVQDYGFVVYPTSFKFDSRTYGGYSENYTTTISHVLPANQPAVEGTFANNLNLSYAPVTKKQVSDNISSKTPINVTFKNMCALIKVTLPAENYNVKEILVESASKGLTGEYSMLWEATSLKQTLKLNSFKSEVKEVALANEDGSNLTPGASYYAVVWPGQHNGLTFTFTDDKGLECVKDLSKTVNCEVGKITEINVKTLTFKEADPELTVNTSDLTFVAAGAEKEISFNTNKNWTITEIPDWLTLDKTSGEPSKDAISVKATCAENTAYTSRTANIKISAGGLTQTIKVTQDAAVKVVSLSVSTTSLSFAGQGGTASFTVTCNDNWTITEIPDWLTLSQTSGTESTSAVTVNVTAKQCYIYQGRKGSFVVSAGDQVKYVNFNQSGPTSLSKGALISYASDLQDGQAYAIESFKQRGNYWNCTNVTDYPLAYSAFGSGVQVFRFAFVYHKDDSKGQSSDSNYNSRSTGTWQLCSSGTYIGSDFRFNKKTLADAMYIAHSNRWGNDNTSDIDMVKPRGTDCIWYSSSGYYWGGTGDGDRKWLIYKVDAKY